MTEEVKYVKVSDLKPYLEKVYLKAKIVEMGEIREVSRGERRVADALVGDDTGCIYLTLWDDSIEEFKVGDGIHIENGYVSVFRGSMRLGAGRFGTVTKIEEELPEVNTSNNISNQEVEERPRRSYGGFGGGEEEGDSAADIGHADTAKTVAEEETGRADTRGDKRTSGA